VTGPAPRGNPLRRAARFVAGRLRHRPDSEHEMVLNRLVIGVLILGYLLTHNEPDSAQAPLMVSIGFTVAAFGIFAHILFQPGVSVVRRITAMLLDLSALSYGMHVGESVTALLYPIYLWVIFGNGFRFGIPYLRIAAAVGVVGFGAVIAGTEYWKENLGLALGLLAGLVVLPLYAGTLIRKLSDAKRQAEEASRAKSLFLASISHELRTPLNAVIGMSDLLTETELDAEQRDMAGTVRTSARALLALIEELLNFSRLEAGRMPKQEIDFDLHLALTEVRGMVEPQAREKGLALGIHVSPRTPYLVHGDRRHLQEILINLAGNAVKFTADGSVVISCDLADPAASATRLRFQVSDTGIGIKPEAIGRIFESFTQADDTVLNRFGGTGLGLAICKQLAELMGGTIGVESEFGAGSTFWVELDLAAAEQGSAAVELSGLQVVLVSEDQPLQERFADRLAELGIALQTAPELGAACRLLSAGSARAERGLVLLDARVSGWEDAAESMAAAGRHCTAALLVEEGAEGLLPRALQSIFIAGLSRAAVAQEVGAVAHLAARRSDSAPTISEAIAAGAQRRLSILVAEDNVVNQKVITKILERAGHQVRVVPNGEEAVDLLLSDRFDLVLMDVNMPVMSGIEATKLYRFAALGRERVPIVALTADATPDGRQRCLEAGMDACLPKPIEAAELFKAIHEMTAPAAEAGEPPAGDTVTDIAAHPRFRAESRSALDSRTLRELETLGGRDFVLELAEEFVQEGERILGELDDAVARGDVLAFHDRLHALRSGAANLGALGLYEICLGLRAVSEADFRAHGTEQLERIRAEFTWVESGLETYRSDCGEGQPRSAAASVSKLPMKAPA
jgi:two-component system, sensor histidine kinase RpfC